MTATQAALAGRREAETLMVTTCTIKRATGEVETDPDTFIEVPVMEPIWSGKCRIKMTNAVGSKASIPGMVLAVQRLTLSVPVVGTETVDSADVVTVTANPLDTGLVGKQFTIKGQHAQTFSSARRFEIEGTN